MHAKENTHKTRMEDTTSMRPTPTPIIDPAPLNPTAHHYLGSYPGVVTQQLLDKLYHGRGHLVFFYDGDYLYSPGNKECHYAATLEDVRKIVKGHTKYNIIDWFTIWGVMRIL
jgi:hypothetical protein